MLAERLERLEGIPYISLLLSAKRCQLCRCGKLSDLDVMTVSDNSIDEKERFELFLLRLVKGEG